MKYKIIDFHTHPYIDLDNSICRYKTEFDIGINEYKQFLQSLGVEKICGSVINTAKKVSSWQDVKELNQTAQKIKNILGDFYVIGYQIHPKYVRESIETIEKMRKNGEVLIGELVPACTNFSYTDIGFEEILENAKGMVISFHSTVSGKEEIEAMDRLIARYKEVTFVGAHPGETDFVEMHINRLKKFDNYYLDISGTGIFRYAMLAHAVKAVGSERILFGSDFPTCAPQMFVGSVAFDNLITETDKENIFYNNAKRILKL